LKSSAKNISLTPLDDLFSTEEERSKDVVGSIVNIPLSHLHDFPNHPFKVRDDEKMQETVESVKAYGVLVPAIVRQRPDGEYEIVAGHRRKRASELAGLNELPAIVRDLDDDAATIIMVDSNLQRENILPSERAQAYKMKLEAIKRQGARTDLTSRQLGEKLSVARIAEDSGDSERQVHRYLRLNNLNPELQEMVDEGRLAFTPAVELSYLKEEEQRDLAVALEETQNTPSLSQAQRIRKMSESGEATREKLTDIMMEEKKPLRDSITLSHDTLKKYFPKSYSIQKIEQIIIKLLENYLKKQRSQEQSR
jgi:ParB family chromosome partitioning protein